VPTASWSSVTTDKKSNGRLFSVALLIIFGRLLLVMALLFLATSFSFGWPGMGWRTIAGGVVGLTAVIFASRVAGSSWTDSIIQGPHQGAALAGAIFLAVMMTRAIAARELTQLLLNIFVLLSLAATISWWLRFRRYPAHRNR